MSQQPEATLEPGPQTEVDYVLHTVALADSAVESVGAAATINFVASAAAVLVAVGRGTLVVKVASIIR